MSHYVYLPLAEISIGGGTQARVEINMATVAEYAEVMTEGGSLPPAVVFFDGAAHHLADGFHRFHANRKIEATSMECDVRTGTLLDAQLYANGANKAHGLQRTTADKRKAVLNMLGLVPDWSDRAIASHVGVDGKTVAAQREAHCGISAVTPVERTYTTKHGTTATMNVAGQKAAGKERAAKPAPAAAPAPPADEYDDMVEDDAPSPAAAAPADPRDAQIKSLEAQVAEYKEALNAELAENTRIGNVLDADDKVAASMASSVLLVAENKQLRGQVAQLRERVNGLVGEGTAHIRRIKSLMAKLKKAGLE